jgi:hypothetical protein
MTARRALALVVLVPALALAGCTQDPSGERSVTDDFETGIDSWDKAVDIPQDPNRPGENVSWSIESSRDVAQSGDYSANYTLDGSQDDGTIWLVRPLTVEEDQAYAVNVTAEAWSGSESSNTLAHLVLYLGPQRPLAEEDFPAPGETTTGDPDATRGGLREELNKQEGWRSYGFEWQIPADHNGTMWAALGISVVWETEVTYFVDDLEIQLDPIETGSDRDA